MPPGFVVPETCACSFGAARQVHHRWAVYAHLQDRPWFLFDFGARHFIERIEIDFGPRAGRPAPATAAYTTDMHSWLPSEPMQDGGRIWTLPVNANVRLISLSFDGFTELRAPVAFRGRPSVLKRDWGEFDVETGTYSPTNNAGFFSNVLVTVSDVIGLGAEGMDVRDVDMRRTFGLYRDFPLQDPYSETFRKDLDADLTLHPRDRPFEKLVHSAWEAGALSRISFDAATSVVRRFFGFRPELTADADRIVRDLPLDPLKTICIYYRGTDKRKEYELFPAERYIEEADGLLLAHPDFRILVQTDEESIRQQLLAHYGERASVVPNVPTSSDGRPLHVGAIETPFANVVPFLLAYVIMVRCRYIVATLSSVTIAMACFRGKADDMIVFHESDAVRY